MRAQTTKTAASRAPCRDGAGAIPQRSLALARHLGGRFEPMRAEELAASSVQILEGKSLPE
jgi:hypothetical protein